MNILIVSEAFVGGGLETHIHTYYTALKNEHPFYFAFGSFNNRSAIDTNLVDTECNFLRDSTIQQFLDDVVHIVQIIHQKKIDVIHVHPFLSLFPVMVASQLTKTPLVYTYHGIASFSFINRLNDSILFYYGLNELIGKVFTVSNNGKKALIQHMHLKNVCFLPNPINTSLYFEHEIKQNRCWAVISRLDADNGKEEALIKLFDILPELNIERIDIYGDGTRKKALMEYASKLKLHDRVHWMGFQADLYQSLNNKYNGIIGTDRVAIEGLAMGYPVLEMGYGRINGIIDQALLEKAMDTNFDANILPDAYDVERLNTMLEQVYDAPDDFNYREIICKHFDSRLVAENYIRELNGTAFHDHANVCEFYRSLCELRDKSENFYESQTVFDLIKRQIEYFAVIPEVKNLCLMGNYMYDMTNMIATHVNGLNRRIDHNESKNPKNQTHLTWSKRFAKRILNKILKICRK